MLCVPPGTVIIIIIIIIRLTMILQNKMYLPGTVRVLTQSQAGSLGLHHDSDVAPWPHAGQAGDSESGVHQAQVAGRAHASESRARLVGP